MTDRVTIVVISVLASIHVCLATPYRTQRLSRMAARLGLSLPDTLESDVQIDSIASYRGKAIRVKTDKFGEVKHIGYRMWDDSLSTVKGNEEYILDFVERYLLDIDLGDPIHSVSERMKLDNVRLTKGTLNMLHGVRTDTPFTIDEITRRMFRFTWQVSEGDISIVFPADNQLIFGADIAELEDIAIRDISRTIPMIADEIILPKLADSIMSDTIVRIDGGSIISDVIRADVFVIDENGSQRLLYDVTYPINSIANMMVMGVCPRKIPLVLSIDKYAHKEDTMKVSLQQYILYCRDIGCKMYFGVRDVTDENVSCSVFSYNEKLGFCHLLVAEVPLSIYQTDECPITATAYTYIPLHNVSEKFFYLYKKEKK